MKFILTILLLITTIYTSAINNVKNLTQYNLDTYITRCCEDLNIDSCFIVVQPTVFKIYGEYEGVMIKTSDRIYTILMCESATYLESLQIVSHELTHIKQYINGEIAMNQINYSEVKKDSGNEYNKSYEKEARETGTKLYEKYGKYSPITTPIKK